MTLYRAAIIGCGPRAEWHAKAYEQITRGKLVACCNRGAGRRTEFAARHGISSYADVAEMIVREKPDIVHLVTGPANRVELMSLISEMKVPACIVEKPVACQVADWKALCSLEVSSGTKFALCHQFRWHKDLTRCRSALQSGKLGRIQFMDFSAGMNISGQGTHLLDYAMSLNEDSPIVRVFGAASGTEGMSDYHPGPDTTIGQVLFANGVYGMWTNGPTARQVGDPNTNWQHVRTAVYASQGHAIWEEFGRWEIMSPGGTTEGHIVNMQQWEAGNHTAQAGLTNAMFDWIESTDKEPGTNLRRGLHQWQAVLGLYASALWRRPVNIPFDIPDDLFTQLEHALKYRFNNTPGES